MNPLSRSLSSLALVFASVPAGADSGADIAGRVIDAITGKGIARARVVVNLGSDREFILLTDDEGIFHVRHIPATSIEISAERIGYLGAFDAVTANSEAWFKGSGLSEGTTAATLKLIPQSVIEGRAADVNGAGGAQVTLWKQGPDGAIESQGFRNVDRTGVFRFAPLAAGRYYLEVSSLPVNSSYERNPGYLHRFYKEGATLLTATPVDVEPGQTQSVSILLQTAHGHQIRGRVNCADSKSSSVLLYLDNGRTFFSVGSWDFQTQTFTFSNVPPGAYLLKGNCAINGTAVGAALPIAVADSDLDGIVLSPSAP